ncbi:MAG TPA: di-trans,poly-cis-decaprenylcistransferase [Arcobacter sp.]|jgi:undecaprenyl diphosphate synthase|nr:di-trans,poly-cis-decaprenylcistransferase [Arcobacter sp.]
MKNSLPEHIAIIMDGNGRWAKEKGLKRTDGHKEGAKKVRTITEHCARIGIKYLTLYAFSTENWSRPKLEVEYLMKLLSDYLENELKTYMDNNIRFETIGDLSRFSKKLQKTIQQVKSQTQNNSGLTQILALNYGSRDEIVRAINILVQNNNQITEENISKSLDTGGFPDVDLLLRTSGEVRLSNFLLWQCAYSEMFFTKTNWPDFSTQELDQIIHDYMYRERRFGGI